MRWIDLSSSAKAIITTAAGSATLAGSAVALHHFSHSSLEPFYTFNHTFSTFDLDVPKAVINDIALCHSDGWGFFECGKEAITVYRPSPRESQAEPTRTSPPPVPEPDPQPPGYVPWAYPLSLLISLRLFSNSVNIGIFLLSMFSAFLTLLYASRFARLALRDLKLEITEHMREEFRLAVAFIGNDASGRIRSGFKDFGISREDSATSKYLSLKSFNRLKDVKEALRNLQIEVSSASVSQVTLVQATILSFSRVYTAVDSPPVFLSEEIDLASSLKVEPPQLAISIVSVAPPRFPSSPVAHSEEFASVPSRQNTLNSPQALAASFSSSSPTPSAPEVKKAEFIPPHIRPKPARPEPTAAATTELVTLKIAPIKSAYPPQMLAARDSYLAKNSGLPKVSPASSSPGPVPVSPAPRSGSSATSQKKYIVEASKSKRGMARVVGQPPPQATTAQKLHRTPQQPSNGTPSRPGRPQFHGGDHSVAWANFALHVAAGEKVIEDKKATEALAARAEDWSVGQKIKEEFIKTDSTADGLGARKKVGREQRELDHTRKMD